ncbi:hypothetical protein EI94DRAFT_1752222 [Lactarius quietus]|nr:hypothetical protein EI94DRAFT_1752222 [Lactarius quietus]
MNWFKPKRELTLIWSPAFTVSEWTERRCRSSLRIGAERSAVMKGKRLIIGKRWHTRGSRTRRWVTMQRIPALRYTVANTTGQRVDNDWIVGRKCGPELQKSTLTEVPQKRSELGSWRLPQTGPLRKYVQVNIVNVNAFQCSKRKAENNEVLHHIPSRSNGTTTSSSSFSSSPISFKLCPAASCWTSLSSSWEKLKLLRRSFKRVKESLRDSFMVLHLQISIWLALW